MKTKNMLIGLKHYHRNIPIEQNHMHTVKTNKHIYGTNVKHPVPNTTSLPANAAQTQEEHMNELHSETYRLPITISVHAKEQRI